MSIFFYFWYYYIKNEIWREVWKNLEKKLEFQDKIATAVYMAILDIETENKKEEVEKLEFLNSLNQIIYNYKDLKPIISEHLKKKKNTNIVEK